MGMFDTVHYNGREYQTKGLDQELDIYQIWDGKFQMIGSDCRDDYPPGSLEERIASKASLTVTFRMYIYSDERDIEWNTEVEVEDGLVHFITEKVWLNRKEFLRRAEEVRAARVATGDPKYTPEEEAIQKAFIESYGPAMEKLLSIANPLSKMRLIKTLQTKEEEKSTGEG